MPRSRSRSTTATRKAPAAIQRARDARRVAPDRARGRLDLSHQRPRGARARRANPVRRRLDRLALARAGASGPHRRDHPGQARAAPPRAGGGGRHFGTARAPARGRAAAAGGRAQPRRGSRTSSASWRPRWTRSSARRGRRSATARSPQQVRKAEATLFHLRWVAANAELAEAEQAKNAAMRAGGRAHRRAGRGFDAPGAAAAELPALREAEARAAAALQRLRDGARDAGARGGARHASAWPSSIGGWFSSATTSSASGALAADAEAALARLGDRGRDAAARDQGERGAARRRRRARRRGRRSALGFGKIFDELTGTLADLTARRHALENAMREHERSARPPRRARWPRSKPSSPSCRPQQSTPICAMLATAAETSQASAADAEAGAVRAEAAHSAARQALDVARGPLAEAERRAQRLDTEAKTLAKLLHVDTKNLWPAGHRRSDRREGLRGRARRRARR